jgi:hypothetical protein
VGKRVFLQSTNPPHSGEFMKVFRALLCFAALCCASFYLNASAAVLRYQMSNVTLSDGSAVYGYVDFDSSTGSIANFAVGGNLFYFSPIPESCLTCDWTEAYIGANPVDWPSNIPTLTIKYLRPGPGDEADLFLAFSPSWNLGDASMGLLAGPDSFFEHSTDDPMSIVNIASGDMTLVGTIPEPPMLALMGIGLMIGAGSRYRSARRHNSLYQ